MSHNRDFVLSEDVDGIFREVCKAYGLDASLLSWQFDKHVMLDGATPFRLSTNNFEQQVTFKDGVKQLEVEVEYNNTNANDIKWVRFHEMPSNKYYIITRTSMQHIDQDSTCSLWFELPQESRREDMSTVQNFSKVEICCEAWKDFLPESPETALERAFLVFASEDVDWIKKQLVHKDAVTGRLTNTIAYKNIEIAALKNEVDRLKGQLDEKLATKKEIEDEKTALKAVIEGLELKLTAKTELLEALDLDLPYTPSPPKSKKRKLLTPKSQVDDPQGTHAYTDPIGNQGGRRAPLPDTPTRKSTKSVVVHYKN